MFQGKDKRKNLSSIRLRSTTTTRLLLTKNEIKIITGLFTGHCPVRYHLKNMDLVENEICRLCESEPETAEHILCKCKALTRLRFSHLERMSLTPDEVIAKPLRNILHFADKVLDLSLNRIRKISENDLTKYGYIQILYLADNVITNISEEALQDKSELHTLDLSYNVLYGVPRTLFHLSNLRKLYLSHIESPNMVEDIENSRPIESPLVYLDLSYNKLHRLPNLGAMPSLVTYNISGNGKIQLSPKDFGGLCSLQLLVNDFTSSYFDNQCECWKAELWLKKRNVTFSSFNCKPIECSEQVAPEDLEIYNNCRKLHETQMIKSFTSKLLTNIGIAAGVVILLLILTLAYIIRRRKQKKIPKNTKIVYQ